MKLPHLYTPKQGRYLAFIHWYTKLNGRPPAEANIQAYFKTTAPSTHQMLVTLEKHGLISREANSPRAVRVLLSPEEIPDLDTGRSAKSMLDDRFPNVASWVAEGGSWIELGWDKNTGTSARAIDEGGMPWGGGRRKDTLEELLQALESGIEDWIEENG